MARKAASAELWDRMPGESVRVYGYFCAYRDMRYSPAASPDDVPKLNLSRERSLRQLGTQLHMNYKSLGEYSSRFNWQMRCDAYDLYILRRQRNKNEAKILKMRENHAAIGEQMLKRALRRLLSLRDEEIGAADMTRMVDIGVKVERLSRGESTEKQEVSGKSSVTHGGEITLAAELPDLSALSTEEMDSLGQLLAKLYPDRDF